MLRQVRSVSRPTARRERRPTVGVVAHPNAVDRWSADAGLAVALDDANGRILYARFLLQEGTASTFASWRGGHYGRSCEP